MGLINWLSRVGGSTCTEFFQSPVWFDIDDYLEHLASSIGMTWCGMVFEHCHMRLVLFGWKFNTRF